MELLYQRTFVPRNEISIGGTFVSWNFGFLELSFPRVKLKQKLQCAVSVDNLRLFSSIMLRQEKNVWRYVTALMSKPTKDYKR